MKLLMISGDRSVLRGKQGAFYNMLEEFSRQWERIDVICPAPPRAAVKPGETSTTSLFGNVFFHPSHGSLLRQPRWIFRKGQELIAEHKHEVMTVHEYPPFYNGIGAQWLHKKTGIPYVLEIHHIVGYPRAASIAEWIGKVLTRLYMRRDSLPAKRIRVVNQTVARLLGALGIPQQKIAVIPSFYLDKETLRPTQNAEKRYDIVFCGRLVKNKGILELIDVLQSMSRVTLVIIGDGALKAAAEKRVEKLGMADRVTFTGWLPTLQDVVDTIQTGRLFVMNSKSEGGPRVALEAMACGMPIVATAVGIMPDVIQNGVNGILVTGDKADLATKIDYLLHEPNLRKAMSVNAQAILPRFERHMLIQQYADFLQSVGKGLDDVREAPHVATVQTTGAGSWAERNAPHYWHLLLRIGRLLGLWHPPAAPSVLRPATLTPSAQPSAGLSITQPERAPTTPSPGPTGVPSPGTSAAAAPTVAIPLAPTPSMKPAAALPVAPTSAPLAAAAATLSPSRRPTTAPTVAAGSVQPSPPVTPPAVMPTTPIPAVSVPAPVSAAPVAPLSTVPAPGSQPASSSAPVPTPSPLQ